MADSRSAWGEAVHLVSTGLRILALLVLALLPCACVGRRSIRPAYQAPTATRRYSVRPTRTPSCDQRKAQTCRELEDLFAEDMMDTLVLCRVKSDEWCVEQLVDLAQQARDADSSSCTSDIRDKAATVLIKGAMAITTSDEELREELVAEMGELTRALSESCGTSFTWP
ncbi:MAG: hypothetical protein ACP5G7_11705 [Anaerolineae bacterium]